MMTETHFVRVEMARGTLARAECGALVDWRREHSAEPTCAPCREGRREFEGLDIADTADDTGIPEPAVDEPDFGLPAPTHALVPLHDIADVVAAEVLPFARRPHAPAAAPLDVPPATRELVTIGEPGNDQVLVQSSLERAASTLAMVEESNRVIPQAEALVVTDAASCALGEDLFDILRTFETVIHAHYDPHCDRAHKVWKGLTDERGAHLKPIEVTRTALGERVAIWRSEQKRVEQAEQRRLEDAAREDQRTTAAREAARALEAGDVATAQTIIEEAKTAPLPVVAAPRSALPRTGKTTTREPWKGYIVDWPALRAQIGRGECPEFDELLQEALQPILNRQATTLKGELGKRYLGTEGRQKPTLAGR